MVAVPTQSPGALDTVADVKGGANLEVSRPLPHIFTFDLGMERRRPIGKVIDLLCGQLEHKSWICSLSSSNDDNPVITPETEDGGLATTAKTWKGDTNL